MYKSFTISVVIENWLYSQAVPRPGDQPEAMRVREEFRRGNALSINLEITVAGNMVANR